MRLFPARWLLGLVLCTLLAACALPRAAQAPDLVVVNMADTHSAYDAYPRLLAGLQATRAQYPGAELVFLFNGDLFELGDSVARKTRGALDWEFLRRLRELGPVVINLGNHEFDFDLPDDFLQTAARLRIDVIGNVGLVTRPTLTPVAKDLRVKGRTVRIVGIGTDQLNTYPQALRGSLTIPEPVAWFRAGRAALTTGADHVIVASHAGLAADLAMLRGIGAPHNIVYWVGGHDHLVLRQEVNGIAFMHNGFKGERYNITEIRFDGPQARTTFVDRLTADVSRQDAALAELTASTFAQQLAPADLAVVGQVPRALSLVDAALWSTDVLRQATGADAAFMSHSTIGAGLAAGPLNQYRFDLFMRFDNDVMVAEVDAPTLRSILARSNQHLATDLGARSGDFLYTRPVAVQDGRRYRIATNSWVAAPANQERYLGVKLEFSKAGNLRVKRALLDALK